MTIHSTPISNPGADLLAEAKHNTKQRAQAHKMAREQANALTAEQKLQLLENMGSSTTSVTNKEAEATCWQGLTQLKQLATGFVKNLKKRFQTDSPPEAFPRFRARTPGIKGPSRFSKQKSEKSGLTPKIRMLIRVLQGCGESGIKAKEVLSDVTSTIQLALICRHLDDRMLASDGMKQAILDRLCQLQAGECYAHLTHGKHVEDHLPSALVQHRISSETFRDNPYVNDQPNLIKNLLMQKAPCAVLMRLQKCEDHDFAITPQEFEASGVTASENKEVNQYDGMALQQLHTRLSGQIQSHFEQVNPDKARSLAFLTQTVIKTGDQLEKLLIENMQPWQYEAFREEAVAGRVQACIDKLFLNADSIEAVAATADAIQARLDQASGNSPAKAIEQFFGDHAAEQDASTLMRIRTGEEFAPGKELSEVSQELLDLEALRLGEGIETKAQQLGHNESEDQAVHDGGGEAERDKLLALAERFYSLANQW